MKCHGAFHVKNCPLSDPNRPVSKGHGQFKGFRGARGSSINGHVFDSDTRTPNDLCLSDYSSGLSPKTERSIP